jgi:hypothetical protein
MGERMVNERWKEGLKGAWVPILYDYTVIMALVSEE